MYNEKIYQDDGIHYVNFSCICIMNFLDMESVGFYIYKSSKIIDFIFNVLHCSNFSKIIYRNETTRIMKKSILLSAQSYAI